MIRKFILALLFGLLALMPGADAAVFYPTSFTLANGLHVIVVPNHLAPAVNQMVWYKVGSSDEAPGKTGLAHYLEHLMFRGSTNVPAGEFSKIIAEQGGEDNAFTAYDYTAYFESVAADRLPMIMQMEADRMQNLRIEPETATPELSVVLDERQQRTDNEPEGRFIEKLSHTLLPNHAYGRPVIGWKKEIERLSPADAREFYRKYYAPNNAIVIISGDVKVEDVMRLAAATYGAVPMRDTPPRKALPAAPMPLNHRLVMKDGEVVQPQITWHFVVPSYVTQKDHEAFAYEVLSEVLDGGEVGKLYRKLVVFQHLASGVDVSYEPTARGDSLFVISATPQPNVKPVVLEKALRAALREAVDKGLDQNSVELAKQRLIRSAAFARDSLMMPGYTFGMTLTTGSTVSDVENWPDHIKAVTTEAVNQAARDLMNNPHEVMGLLLPDSKIPPGQRPLMRAPAAHEMGIR